MSMLEQSPHLDIDGTFKTAPQLFTQSVLVDYELVLRSAVLKVWLGTSLRSCWFHYKQALFRHLQAEGLAADYMVSDSPIKTCSTIYAMPYDPEEAIELAWKELKLTLPPEMTSFARYYETNWIGTASSPPLFDNASWNHHDSSLMRLLHSSNIAEGWNKGFSYGTILEFLRAVGSRILS